LKVEVLERTTTKTCKHNHITIHSGNGEEKQQAKDEEQGRSQQQLDCGTNGNSLG
jgi:hypothetical protein